MLCSYPKALIKAMVYKISNLESSKISCKRKSTFLTGSRRPLTLVLGLPAHILFLPPWSRGEGFSLLGTDDTSSVPDALPRLPSRLASSFPVPLLCSFEMICCHLHLTSFMVLLVPLFSSYMHAYFSVKKKKIPKLPADTYM